MKYPRTSEGYALYLKSDHWDALRTVVLERDQNTCVRCSGPGWQVHHKFYREDWETAQPSDCETLCRPCHENEHQIKPCQPVVNSKKELESLRSQLQITREEYLRRRDQLMERGAWFHRKKARKKFRKPKVRKVRQGCKPWFYSPRRMHWISRGTSSN